jgi:NADH dehydrogenase
MILVVGATGLVGRQICRLLTASGEPTRAMVRATSDQAKVDELKSLGANVVQGDLCDPGSIQAACQGASAVIATASSMPFAYRPGENTPETTDEGGYLCLIEAAREAGVGQFIYTSFPPVTASFPLQDAKRAVEDRLHRDGLTYTILQPTYFMEVWLNPAVGFDYANRKATIYGSGHNPLSWISFLDVAQFAAASLDNAAARYATLELGGPEALSPVEVVGIFERTDGARPFEVQSVPLEALQGQYAATSDPMQKSFAAMMLSLDAIRPIDIEDTLKSFPLTLKMVREYAAEVLAA